MVTAKAVSEQTLIDEQEGLNADVSAWSDISNYMTSLTESLDTLRSYETWNTMAATVSDVSALSATAGTGAIKGTYAISVSDMAQAHIVRSTSFSSATADLSSGGGTGAITDGATFQIGGIEFTVGADEYGQTVSGTESLTTLCNKINYASSSMTDPVTASVVQADSTHYYLVLTRVETGDTYIDSQDTSGSTLQNLQIRSNAGPGDNYVTVLRNHQDASFDVNGLTITRSSNTGLTDVISGVTLNILSETTGDVTLTVGADTSGIKTAILDFVEKYNALAAKLTDYGKISLNSTNGTVTDTGELYNDSLVAELARNIRSQATSTKNLQALYDGYKGSSSPPIQVVNPSYSYNSQTGACDSLDDIGIWTTSQENELEVVDEERLDYLLQNNFDQVKQLFRGVYDPEEGYIEGIASDFYQYANNASADMDGTIAAHVQTLNDKISDLEEQISQMDEDLQEYEQELWEIFTDMEDAIEEINSQKEALKALTTD
jgi:flagellar hook-associated protein 2